MLIGHYGVAFALKRAEPRISLGTLFVAVALVDILWGGTLLLGWEHVRIVPGYMAASPLEFLNYPITHSLLGGLGWGVAASLVYFSWPTTNVSHHWRASFVVGLAVVSHWFLDLIVHGPDLPLGGAGTVKYGFGLWNSVPGTVAVELGFVAVGAVLYISLHSHRHPVRPIRLAALLAVIVATLLAATFGPVPGSVTSVAIGASVLGLVMALLAWWADRPVPPAPGGATRSARQRHAA